MLRRKINSARSSLCCHKCASAPVCVCVGVGVWVYGCVLKCVEAVVVVVSVVMGALQ